MDYIFQNIEDVISIEMTSEKSGKITSMKSSFENYNNLEKIKINGFDTSQVTSMHKLFYNSYISDENFYIDLNMTNVEDMSYMFFQVI